MPSHAFAPLPFPCSGRLPLLASWTQFWHGLARRIAGFGAEGLSVRLAAEQELHLHEAAGWTVVCCSGFVWLTQEADARDIFLTGGETFALDRKGLTLVRACCDSVLSVHAPAGRGLAGGLRRSMRELGAESAAAHHSTDLLWLKTRYPECGPWNDPVSYRRAGLL